MYLRSNLVDFLAKRPYNKHMNRTNDTLQWAGAVAIILMHVLNALGPDYYPYNIYAAFLGTVLFLAWTVRVRNAPQFTVNVIALGIGLAGIWKAM
jgi:hypothetical protein